MSDNALQIIVDELAAARKSEAEFRKAHAALLARLNDDALADTMATCPDPTCQDYASAGYGHNQLCEGCVYRRDVIAAYRDAVREGGGD